MWGGNDGMEKKMETIIMGFKGSGFRVGRKEWKRKWKLL